MRENDSEYKLDELEQVSLQKVISEVETALAVSTPGTRGVFENLLSNARGRLGTLEKKIKETKEEKEAQAREEATTIAQLAENETSLSREEKKTYSGFLKEEYFTKKDFNRLEQFYAHTWDRLSEKGKNEMSHRVWEGIRRDEYIFSELPETVQGKEADRVYTVFKSKRLSRGAPRKFRQVIAAISSAHTRQATKPRQPKFSSEKVLRKTCIASRKELTITARKRGTPTLAT